MTRPKELLPLLLSFVLLLSLCACTPAETTPQSIAITPPASLSAVKLDANGNALGNVTLKFSGNITDEQADVEISPFDDLVRFMISSGKLLRYDFADFYFTIVIAYSASQEEFYCPLIFSPDGDYWLFSNETAEVYYYGSVSGTATTEELVDYFAPWGLKKERPAS